MELLRTLRRDFNRMHPVCRKAVSLLAGLSACYITTALFAYCIAPVFPGYFRSMLIFREGVKSAVTSLLIAAILALAGDRMLGHEGRDV